MTAWKDLERRVCRALGAERRPSVGRGGWARGTDDDGSAPFAVEVKRTKRWQLRAAWIVQARRNAKADGRPWLLVIATHGTPRPIAVLDFWTLVQLATEAGRLPDVRLDDDAMSYRDIPGVSTREEREAMSEQETPQPPSEPSPEGPNPDEEDPRDDGDDRDD